MRRLTKILTLVPTLLLAMSAFAPAALAATDFYPGTIGSANPYYGQYYNSSYTIALDNPTTMYAGNVYTLKAIITSNSGVVYDSHYYNNPNYYDNYYSYYSGEHYIYYDSYSVSSGYYPYSTTHAQVYAGGAWVTPINSTAIVTLSELSAQNLSPMVRWSSVMGSDAYPYTASTQNPGVKVTFSTDSPSSLVQISQITDQSASFQALQPGTYNLTLSILTGYVLSDGDTRLYNRGDGMYFKLPTGTYGPYSQHNPSYANTMKTYQIIVLPNPSGATTPPIPYAPAAIAPRENGILPGGAMIGQVLKNGVTVTNAAGIPIGTLPMGTIVILNTVGSQYEIAFAGGTGFVPKALINRISTTLPQNGVIRTISIGSTVFRSSRTTSKKLTKLSGGTSVIEFGTSNGWSYIYADGKFGYIQSSFASR